MNGNMVFAAIVVGMMLVPLIPFGIADADGGTEVQLSAELTDDAGRSLEYVGECTLNGSTLEDPHGILYFRDMGIDGNITCRVYSSDDPENPVASAENFPAQRSEFGIEANLLPGTYAVYIYQGGNVLHQWTLIVLDVYVITFDSQGGYQWDQVKVKRGDAVGALPDATHPVAYDSDTKKVTTYTFGGWWTDPVTEAEGTEWTSATVPTGDTTIYAHWTADLTQYERQYSATFTI